MEFRILGPLEVTSDGRTLELGGAKQRALLGMLLLQANKAVSVDRLIDALWEEEPPENAHKALQVHISALRKVVGRERLETTPGGYTLRVGEDELDLGKFRQLQTEERLSEALALWRGPPLSDFAYDRFAQSEIVRLEEERLTCVERRVEQELATGRHAEVTGELEALVAEHPLREPLRRLLMLALYRSGRQAQALEAYQQGRNALVEDLGIEPGRELRALHQAILKQDPALDVETPSATPRKPKSDLDVPAAEPSLRPRQARKTVTAVSVGIHAATEGGESLDPEALRRVQDVAFRASEGAIARHGGSVESMTNDGLTAVFGLPVLHDDDAMRAVRAADETRRLLRRPADEPAGVPGVEVRIGIATGEVVTAEPGSRTRAVGKPLTASARLCQSVEAGEIFIDRPTYRLVRDAVMVEAADPAFRLVQVRPEPHRQSGRADSPMVGRGRESRQLAQAFEQAVSGSSCQLFTVLGAAGVGKSRLVQEFLDGLADQAVVARGRCLPYGEGITFWPLLEAVTELVGIEDTDSAEQGHAKLVAACAGEHGAEEAARRVAETIGLVEAGIGAEEPLAGVRLLFEAAARRQPLVLVFDDVHWGESNFLDLLDYLADWTREVPMLLLCLARPDFLDVRPGWGGGKLNATSILLEPLSEGESLELIENLSSVLLGDETKQRIAEASEGNPLFVEEMLALALEQGGSAADISVPPTIQALLAARLDRLEDDERAVLDVAAVQGKVFYEGAAASLLPHDLTAAIATPLESLLHKELIRPDRPSLGGRAYRFRHLLIRDAAYESIPKETRSVLHERFARWLEGAAGDRATEYEEIVGYHLEQAYRYRAELADIDEDAQRVAREAAERLSSAAQRALVRSDAPAGINLISRAVALLPADDRRRVDLIPNVRVVQGLGADLGWADRVLTEAVESAAATGDRGLAAHALVQRALLRLFTEPDVSVKELIDVADRAVEALAGTGDELGLARAWRLKAQAYYLGRCATLSAEASERALAHASRAADRFEQREIEEWLVIALVWGPVPVEEALDRCNRLLAESAGQPERESLILGALALLTTMAGRIDQSRAFATRARQVLDDLRAGVWLVSFHLAEAALAQGDAARAEAQLRPIYEKLKTIGEKSHFSAIAQLLAEAVYQEGRLEEAEQLTTECEQAAHANDVHDQIRWRAVRAKVLATRGEVQAAETLAREAVALALEGDFLVARAGALSDLAEVLGRSDRPEAAAAAAQDAIEYYELKGNVLAAERACAKLTADEM